MSAPNQKLCVINDFLGERLANAMLAMARARSRGWATGRSEELTPTGRFGASVTDILSRTLPKVWNQFGLRADRTASLAALELRHWDASPSARFVDFRAPVDAQFRFWFAAFLYARPLVFVGGELSAGTGEMVDIVSPRNDRAVFGTQGPLVLRPLQMLGGGLDGDLYLLSGAIR